VLLLIDERAGRAVAQELGITVAGTAAVIGMAHQRGLISSARDVFAALHASDFRIAPAVIQAVLDRCGNAAPIDGDEPPTAQSG
jgi:predicted nucleic acid-binding protein